jgi:outer membrane protein
MKNRLTVFSVLFAILAIPLIGQAQAKVALINMSAAIGSTGEGKKAIADLQKKYQPRQQELERLQQEIQSIQDQLSKQSATLSDEEQRRLSRDLEDKQKLLKRSSDDAQTDITADRDEAILRISQKMTRIINDYAQQNGLALVIDGAQVPVYYYAKDSDITAEIVKRYDAANPVAEAAAPAKPAAKPATPAATAKPK